MQLYITEEKYVKNKQKYVCFGAKALKELEQISLGVEIINTIKSTDFKKIIYPTLNDEYIYFFHDTNDKKYLKNIDKILSQ